MTQIQRISALRPWTQFVLCRTGEVLIKVQDGDILAEDGTESNYQASSRAQVIGEYPMDKRAALLASRKPWKVGQAAERMALAAASTSEHRCQDDPKVREALAVLTDQIATLTMENSSLKKILYHLATTTLPEPGKRK